MTALCVGSFLQYCRKKNRNQASGAEGPRDKEMTSKNDDELETEEEVGRGKSVLFLRKPVTLLL